MVTLRLFDVTLPDSGRPTAQRVPGGTAENAGVVGPNNIYWTGMASLILEVYMHFLPAYQR